MKKEIEVTYRIEVEVDESKFTDKYMEEFREVFYNFNTIDEHMEHLAQLYARDICDNNSFIEGYGQAENFGIRFKEIDIETNINE